MVLLEFSISPLDKGQSVSAYVARSLGIIEQSGLDYRLHRANTALCELLGYSERELLERTFNDLTHPDDRRRDRALAGNAVLRRPTPTRA